MFVKSEVRFEEVCASTYWAGLDVGFDDSYWMAAFQEVSFQEVTIWEIISDLAKFEGQSSRRQEELF